MPIPDKEQEKAIRAGLGGVAGTFEVSVIGGEIVLHALKHEAVKLGDVLVAGEAANFQTGDGLSVSAEIIAEAKGDKVVVFKKRRRHNYRRKKAQRQQHTILRIVAISDKSPANDAALADIAKPKPLSKAARSTSANKAEEEAEFGELAIALDEAAERMGMSLNRAIESVRTALDPEREIAVRKRFEAEFAGTGGDWLQGVA